MRCVHVVCELTTNSPWAEGDKLPQFQSKGAIPSSLGLVSPFIPLHSLPVYGQGKAGS